jgi:hypothetical protein
VYRMKIASAAATDSATTSRAGLRLRPTEAILGAEDYPSTVEAGFRCGMR